MIVTAVVQLFVYDRYCSVVFLIRCSFYFLLAGMNTATVYLVVRLAVALCAVCCLSRAQHLYVATPVASVPCHHAMRVDWDAARGTNKYLRLDTGGSATFSLVGTLATPWMLLHFVFLAVSRTGAAPAGRYRLVGVATVFSAAAVVVAVSCLRPCWSL